ncbi:hypothetical protein CEUSTIGMA_g1451.t1 [Chlamydomonas eustigma]|uniref:Cysteine-rich PDZ-binding protein n=1 Tax=Chlamydomonas eustigma TaxID=1157962 RepID=A0A250WT72_9CHLO|nr:hypothetical protein CEUSTIGMA_g1451.t1 [Chlamydomonas eustigma]|eukprot:GAX74001.1 hypothetical protein CEUSTIGMA_g1451.t1 [Chlamydomonas eustigma]
MVCSKCEKKLAKNAPSAPDPWKAGASNTMAGGGRKINENKMLSKKDRYSPYGAAGKKCATCKSMLNKDGMFCHTCAYTKGVCEMCGVQIQDTKNYKQSNK